MAGWFFAYDGNTFAYDARGRRTAKNGITFIYDSNGNLIKQSNGLEFFYDNMGVFATKFDNATYYYRKDAQGNIIALLDNTGMVVVKYRYDAWGKCQTTVVDPNASTIAELNPFRYRGYYFDTETNLYFLKTRYYDPEIGRFITIDDISYLDPKTINGLNLYAYCGNNPVMEVDPTGRFPGIVMQLLASALSYVGMAVASIFNPTVREDMNRIHWNPFNSNENLVLASNSVSFYKGVPVFRTDGQRSGTFLGIFLTHETNTRSNPIDVVKHEWGHISQQLILGPIPFLVNIGIPSATEMGSHKWPAADYYNRPWETSADMFGGVSTVHTQAEKTRAIWYMVIAFFLGPVAYLFAV